MLCMPKGKRERDECQLERKRDLRTRLRASSDTISPRELCATLHLSKTTTACPVTRTPATLLYPEASKMGASQSSEGGSASDCLSAFLSKSPILASLPIAACATQGSQQQRRAPPSHTRHRLASAVAPPSQSLLLGWRVPTTRLSALLQRCCAALSRLLLRVAMVHRERRKGEKGRRKREEWTR
jgi:hypothetical protein